MVPWIEVLLGSCFIVGFWMRSTALASFFLLASFGVAIGINLLREADITCGCFGLDGTEGSLTGALIRDVLMIFSATILYYTPSTFWSADRLLGRE